MQKYFFLFMIVNLCLIFCLSSNNTNNEEYPEITSEEFAEYEVKYINEQDEGEKKYLEAVVKPERFDVNKDRKLSKEEIKQALIYVTYPKDNKKKKQIPDEVNEHINNNIDLFLKNIRLSKLNFKQFSYLMRKVSLTQFMNFDTVKSSLDAKKDNRIEGESDL